MKKNRKKVNKRSGASFTAGIILVMAAPFLRIIFGYYFALQTVAAIMRLVGMILLIVSMREAIFMPTAVFMIAYPVVHFLQIYPSSRRLGYAMCVFYLIAVAIYCVILMRQVLQGCKRVREHIVENLLFPPIALLYLLVFSMIDLFEMIELQSGNLFQICLITALVCAILAVILYIVLKKCRSERPKWVKSTVICFVATFGCALLVMIMLVPTVNYAFDFSEGQIQRYEIIEKEFKINTGKYSSGDIYYLIIDQNGEEERLDVTAERYRNSEVGDYITATLRDGFLRLAYLEYQ